jgi:hypothetical protein
LIAAEADPDSNKNAPHLVQSVSSPVNILVDFQQLEQETP